jgi:four helix bundle protein
MKYNILQEKSFNFALKSIDIYKHLIAEKKEFILSKQFLRSSTSIGANIEESIGAYSKNDFTAKISIAYKESRETKYWIKLLEGSNYINEELGKELFKDCDELGKIMAKILIRTRGSFN